MTLWEIFRMKWKQPAPDGGWPSLQHHVFHACASVTIGAFFAALAFCCNLLFQGQLPYLLIGVWGATIAYLSIEAFSIFLADPQEDALNALHDVVQAMTFLWPVYFLSVGEPLYSIGSLIFFLAAYFVILYYKP